MVDWQRALTNCTDGHSHFGWQMPPSCSHRCQLHGEEAGSMQLSNPSPSAEGTAQVTIGVPCCEAHGILGVAGAIL